MELQWIFNHTDDVKNVIVSVLSTETADDLDRFKANIEESIDIVFDLLREPAQALGVEIDLMRDFPSERSNRVLEELEKLHVE